MKKEKAIQTCIALVQHQTQKINSTKNEKIKE